VRPDPGLEVLLTNRQNDLIVEARRKRDFLPWEEVAADADSAAPKDASGAGETDSDATAAGPPVPTPEPDAGDSDAAASSTETDEEAARLKAEAAKAARRDPATIDPQLQRALEYLEQQLDDKPKQPGRA
jgi:hypothetical protein